MLKYFYVYIISSQKNGTLYIGITNNLIRRISEHKSNKIPGFTKKYKIHNLVYYETFYDSYNAIMREKQLKKWNREWKIKLIEKENPYWNDLYDSLIQMDPR